MENEIVANYLYFDILTYLFRINQLYFYYQCINKLSKHSSFPTNCPYLYKIMSDQKIQKIVRNGKVKMTTAEINQIDEYQYDDEPIQQAKTKKVIQTKNKDKQINNNKNEIKKYKSTHKTQGITISKAKRQLNKPISTIDPGPCSYETQVLPRYQSITFTRASGHEGVNQKITNRVGPGTYYPEQLIKKSKKAQYTIGSKYQSFFDIKNKMSPGPGQYDSLPQILTSKKSTSPNKGFGTSLRFSMQHLVPGPGSYQTYLKNHESINKKRTISNSGRQLINKSQQNPGPGDYQNKSSFEKTKQKGITIAFRYHRNSESNLTNQAFNKYTIRRQFDNGDNKSGFSIGQQKRKFIQPCITPSPQDYQASRLYAHIPAATISQSKVYQSKVLSTPGPGSYEQSTIVNANHAKYTFPKSKSSSIVSAVSHYPGVGKYQISEITLKNTVKKGSLFPKQKKLQNNSLVSVGVGDYNINPNNQSKGFTIPKADTRSRVKNV